MTESTTSLTSTSAPQPAELVQGFSLITLIMSLVGLAVLVIVGFFWHRFQVDNMADSFLQRADQLETVGEWGRAAEYVHRYLRINPNDEIAQIKLAQTYTKAAVQQPQRQRAIELTYKAIGVADEASATKLHRSLVELLIANGRFQEAAEESSALLQKSPLDAEMLKQHAFALFAQFNSGELGKTDQAKQKIGEALRLAADHNASDKPLAVLMASVLRDRPEMLGPIPGSPEERITQADRYIDNYVDANDKSAEALLVRYQYRRKYNLAGADMDLKAARELAPNNVDILYAAGLEAIGQAQANDSSQEDVRAIFQKLHQLAPQNEVAYLTHGDFLVSRKEFKDAEEVWKEGLKQTKSTSLILLERLSQLQVEKGDLEEAADSIKAFEDAIANQRSRLTLDVRRRLESIHSLSKGKSLLRAGKLPQAEEQLARVTIRQTTDPAEVGTMIQAWFLLGEVYHRWGQDDRAASAFEQAVKLKPQFKEALQASAIAWQKAGQPRKAVGSWRRLAELSSTKEAYLSLAAAELAAQKQQRMGQRQWSGFTNAIAEATRLGGDNWQGAWVLQLLTAEGHLIQSLDQPTDTERDRERQACLTLLTEVELENSQNLECLQRVALFYQAIGQSQSADRVVKQMQSLPKSEVVVAQLQAELWILRGKLPEARQALTEALATAAPENKASLRESLTKLANLESGSKLTAADLEQALAKDPMNIQFARRLAEQALANRDWEALEKRHEPKLVAIEGEKSPTALYFRILRLLATSKTGAENHSAQAAKLQEQLRQIRPDWSHTYLTEAAICLYQRRADDAIRAYQRAIELGESRLTVYEALGKLLRSQRRLTEADQLITSLRSRGIRVTSQFDDLELSVATGLGQFPRALELAKAKVAKQPNDAQGHQWLGELQLLSDLPKEAEQSFKRAVELAPEDLTAWLAMLQFYLRTGANEQARTTLEKVASLNSLPANQRGFVLGQGYEALGDEAAARTHYLDAEKQDSLDAGTLFRIAQFFQTREPGTAIAQLRRARQLSPQTSEISRQLITLLAARGEDTDWQEIDSLWSGELSDNDQVLKAILTLRRPGGDVLANLRTSRETLERLVKSESNPDDTTRRVLAQLYLRESALESNQQQRLAKLTSAREQLLTMAARNNADEISIVQQISYLLQYESAEKAAPWKDKLANLLADKQNLDLDKLARLLVYFEKFGFTKDVERYLKIYSDQLEAQKELDWNRVKVFVELCLQNKLPESATPWLSELREQDAEDLTTLSLQVRQLNASGKHPEALALLVQFKQHAASKSMDPKQQMQLVATFGQLYQLLGENNNATTEFQKLWGLNPSLYGPLMSSLIAEQKLPDAIRICEQAQEKDKSAKPLIQLLQALLSSKATLTTDHSIEPLITKALESSPGNKSLLLSLGLFRTIQNDPLQAEKIYRELLATDPNNIVVLNNLAVLLGEQDKAPEAIELLDRSIALAGPAATLLDSKGVIYLRQGRSAEAIQLLKVAVSPPNTDPRHHLHLAAALWTDSAANRQAAKAELDKADRRELEKQPLTTDEKATLEKLRKALSEGVSLQTLPPTNTSMIFAPSLLAI